MLLLVWICSLVLAGPPDTTAPPAPTPVHDPGYPDYPTGIPHRREGGSKSPVVAVAAAASGWWVGSLVGGLVGLGVVKASSSQDQLGGGAGVVPLYTIAGCAALGGLAGMILAPVLYLTGRDRIEPRKAEPAASTRFELVPWTPSGRAGALAVAEF